MIGERRVRIFQLLMEDLLRVKIGSRHKYEILHRVVGKTAAMCGEVLDT